ncbi:Protein DEHYDRATION-INDUCED 19 [Zostera marina]|uniref:Protein DEHYDRATION-INDUCED 19 n=1 Tax=Zostera marina TaxID=29655 RepID=A0A0K9PGN7_ZOSMR|nr:Protein DEHYDRATION-INDUCED 19 [Zostera marina]
MDADLWASRLAAAKRQYSLQQQNQNSQFDRLGMDDYEMEEEMRLEFPCPYCYEEYDITALCVHLEDEHPFESKVIICSICSAKVNRNLLNHITSQHRHLFKMSSRRKRLRKVSIPSSQSFSLMGKDLREAHLQALLASSGLRPCYDDPPPAAVPDSLLSSLVLNYPTPEADVPKPTTVSTPDDTSKNTMVSSKTWKSGLDPSLTYEEREQKLKQAAVRATFVQGLLISTLFGD